MGKRREGCRFVSQSHTSSHTNTHTPGSLLLLLLLLLELFDLGNMKFAYTAYAAVALLALAASASADCENIDYNSTAGEWMSYIGGPPELESFFSEVSVVFSAIEGTPFFTPSWHSDHADLDGDGVIEGLPGPISP